MICGQCGTENEAGRKFCLECGTPLAVTCASCGSANSGAAKFCGECGTALAGTSSGAASRAAEGATQYAGAAPQAPVAERRVVSILFVDLVGFTAFAEGRDAEDVREVLSGYFSLARETVARYGGTIEKFIGDAVMAVWGAPVAYEDDAERAVRAALDVVDGVAALDNALVARAAVVTGEAAVTLGAVGEGMVTGDAVNTASRLQAVAPDGTVLVSDATRNATRAAIAYERIDDQLLKGKSLQVVAWRALRVVGGRRGAGRSELLEPPFVAREGEFRQLKEMLHTTSIVRRARVVSIVGQAGVGKSRLVWELEKYVDGIVEGVYWHYGRSPSHGDGITFWALGEMVRQRARIAETDDADTSRARLAEALADYVPDAAERAWIEAHLQMLLGLTESPAAADQAEVFAAWRRFFERVAERGTTVLVFEDLQWADSGLLDFIASLVEWTRHAPLLVITLARPELFARHPAWGAGQLNFTSIHLEPLADAEMSELLLGLAPGLPPEAVRSIVDRAEGIPLYAVETVRMLIDGGSVVRDEETGTYRATADLRRPRVAESLHALIAARLDGLSSPERELVSDASVIGQTFTIAALDAFGDRLPADIERALLGLVRRQLLARVDDPTSPERGQFSFVQSVVREVAYDTMSRATRRAKHIAAARRLEAEGEEQLAPLLASHYYAAYQLAAAGAEAGALAAQARVALRSAGDRAAALHSYEQAIGFFEQALSVTTDPAEQAALLERLGAAADAAARAEDSQRYYERAIATHRGLADPAAANRASARLGSLLMFHGHVAEAIELLTPVLAEVEAGGDQQLAGQVGAQLGRAHMLVEDNGPALAYLDRALAAAAAVDDLPTIVDALTSKGPALDASGRHHEAVAALAGALELIDMHGLTQARNRTLYNLAGRLFDEDPRRANELFREGLARARQLGQRQWLLSFGQGVVAAHVSEGNWDMAVELAEELRSGPMSDLERASIDATEATISAYRGEHAAAAQLMAGALQLMTGLTKYDDVGWTHFLNSEVHFAAGRYREAYAALIESARSNYFAARNLPIAAGYALLLRDPELMAGVLAGIAAVPPLSGRFMRAVSLRAQACAAVLRGQHDEAAVGFRSSIDDLRAMGQLLDVAETAVFTVAGLGLSHPFGRQAEQEARQILEPLGAHGLLARLDEVINARPMGGDRLLASAPEPSASSSVIA